MAGEAGSDYPPALARHLDELGREIPGNGGESGEGPGGADFSKLQSLAFPDTDIPLPRLTAEQAASDDAQGQQPVRPTSRWVSVGPSRAIYPFFGPRDITVYVPNVYAAASRIDAMALAPRCVPGDCRLWIGPAGGGIWRTDDALANPPAWRFVSGPFAINSIGSITLDQHSGALWVGTGEANTCGSGCVHGVGLYKSTDGGDTWTGPFGASAFAGRGVGSIAIDPRDSNVMYASSTMGLHGMTSVCCSGISRIVVPGASMWGVFKSSDGGNTWTYIHGGSANASDCANANPAQVVTNTTPCTPRGVRLVVLDPVDPDVVYASSYARGVWRSNDGGATWTPIKASLNPSVGTTLPWIAVTTLSDGNTRMYVSEGNTGSQFSRVFRSDSVRAGAPVWSDLTSDNRADTRWGTFNFCTGQCWYDNFVFTPAGYPDIVYVGGSYSYGELVADHRAVVLSTDAGTTWTDMTADATDAVHPNALHPDQHAILTNPNNPFQFFEGNDGGVMRSSGQFADMSSTCTSSTRGLTGVSLARCQQMLSRIPTTLMSLNLGLTTLQFQSVSVSPFDPNEVQGGTQDNGTWENHGSRVLWTNSMIGDGGQSGFDVNDPHFRFHTFFAASPDVNFSDGATADWNWIADPIFGTEPQEFYVPMISDPRVSRTLFVGTGHVWRTKTAGLGTMTVAQLRQHCNEWTGDFTVTCGDWQPLGKNLTAPIFGDRAGGDVVALMRSPIDTSTLWVATSRGRVFVSHNADAEPASAVTFTRVDNLVSNAPNRFISSIFGNPDNPDSVLISYSGFSAATPATPGHIFRVTFDAQNGTASFTSLDRNLGDLPITSVVRDADSGTLFASTDFGVLRLDPQGATWTQAAPGMPGIEVPGLTIVPGKLYAATHAQGVWLLNLQNSQ
ncbi:MAG TPA: sialidase family protein [Candidatus Dormibacteraeota bacterium]|nr:sialidase family protein [Candidatus Dormibacteraeota bacterium]